MEHFYLENTQGCVVKRLFELKKFIKFCIGIDWKRIQRRVGRSGVLLSCGLICQKSAFEAKGPRIESPWRQYIKSMLCLFEIKLRLGPTFKKRRSFPNTHGKWGSEYKILFGVQIVQTFLIFECFVIQVMAWKTNLLFVFEW